MQYTTRGLVTPRHSVGFRWTVGLAALAVVGAIAAGFAIAQSSDSPAVGVRSQVVPVAAAVGTPAITPALAAETARLTGLAEMYAQIGSTRDPALTADTARWSGLAERFAEIASSRDLALTADAARWSGLAEMYAGIADAQDAVLVADSARWTGLATYFAQDEGLTRGQNASRLRWEGLAERFTG